MDDASATFWSSANLDVLISLTLDDLWQDLLRFEPSITSQLDEITTLTSPGYIRLPKTTDTPVGDLTQRFFTIQSVTRDGREYSPIDPRDVVIEDNEVKTTNAGDFRYFKRADQLWLLPLETTPAVEFRYSFLPATFSSLADGNTVVWPEGSEGVYTFESAGRAMMKGDREESAHLLGIANLQMKHLRARVSRPFPGPLMPFQPSTPQAWGSD